ncbi:MAG: ATP-binding protein [Candidatus Hamiltonella defensa (Ceratovacuna japonica)]
MLDTQEKITDLKKNLRALKQPPEVIPNTVVLTQKVHCEQHGLYERRVRQFRLMSGFETHSTCPGCIQDNLEALRQTQKKNEKRLAEQQIIDLMRRLNLPPRFQSATLNHFEPVNPNAAHCLKVCQAYAHQWPERRQQGGGMVMCGKPGTGKTHLALGIAQHIIHTHQSSVLFTSALHLMRVFKSTWSQSSQKTEAEVVQSYTSPDLLIIDEIGVQFGSDAEKMILFDLINSRYEAMKPTFLLSNLPKDALPQFLGERVMDRMNEGGGCTLVFTWGSYRSRKVPS